ncbi:hypothetical protein R0131_00810 [Clostridium sp. AL.422]|uniref:hypothetical protein n=1 Tax=Clostridium TaxID=1485 RepID=UPI00293DAEA5|nr:MULTISPECIES: hypothetical protein [unclassified Clostridium]MDV4149368.1 hypothetical protein [Clostridium sp. AL.422]
MKLRKKKKGSTFVIVIFVMAIIFTTGTTILAVTANDYKMRINQSKKIKNLYEADSGLDIVENTIIKTSQEAIKYADKELRREFTELDNSYTSKEELNKLFKEKFYYFLSHKETETSGELLEKLIKEKLYIKSISDNGVINYAPNGMNKDIDIQIPEEGYKVNKHGEVIESITIKVHSTFETKLGEFKNRKTVSTEYEVFAPEYNTEITSINISPVFDGKAITADGNMNVESSANKSIVNINGDIWIKGNNNLGTDPEYTFDKYIGGIKLDNTSFNITGNIYTANTYHLNNNAQSVVNGDTFAKNIYVGKSINSNVSQSNNVSFEKNVIVNNDLALNATSSNITISKNFYGINDKTTDTETANKALKSSSIIVNDTSGTSKLTVEHDSYIMGVAYLNATDASGQKYQTGESVAIKGNYLAYTDVQDILDGKNNVTLKYYSPLQLLESKDNNSDANMKADYFAEYYYQDKNHYKFNEGGVELKGNVKSVGASVKDSEGNILKSNIDDNDIKLINEQRNEFARNVYAMGDATGYEDLYAGQEVKRTVENQVDFGEIRRIQGSSFDESEGIVILKGNENDVIEIKDNEYNGQIIEKGLIITNRDITIEGDFDFKGNIITTGNIILKGEGEKNIAYDPQVIRSILSLNYDFLKDIFIKAQSSREEIRVNSDSELYSVEKFMKKSLWKIIK